MIVGHPSQGKSVGSPFMKSSKPASSDTSDRTLDKGQSLQGLILRSDTFCKSRAGGADKIGHFSRLSCSLERSNFDAAEQEMTLATQGLGPCQTESAAKDSQAAERCQRIAPYRSFRIRLVQPRAQSEYSILYSAPTVAASGRPCFERTRMTPRSTRHKRRLVPQSSDP